MSPPSSSASDTASVKISVSCHGQDRQVEVPLTCKFDEFRAKVKNAYGGSLPIQMGSSTSSQPLSGSIQVVYTYLDIESDGDDSNEEKGSSDDKVITFTSDGELRDALTMAHKDGDDVLHVQIKCSEPAPSSATAQQAATPARRPLNNNPQSVSADDARASSPSSSPRLSGAVPEEGVNFDEAEMVEQAVALSDAEEEVEEDEEVLLVQHTNASNPVTESAPAAAPSAAESSYVHVAPASPTTSTLLSMSLRTLASFVAPVFSPSPRSSPQQGAVSGNEVPQMSLATQAQTLYNRSKETLTVGHIYDWGSKLYGQGQSLYAHEQHRKKAKHIVTLALMLKVLHILVSSIAAPGHSHTDSELAAAKLQLLNQSMQIDNLTMHYHYLQQEIYATRAEYETIRSELNECQMQGNGVEWTTLPNRSSHSRQQSGQQWSAWLDTWKPYVDSVTETMSEAAESVKATVEQSTDQAQQWLKDFSPRKSHHRGTHTYLPDQLHELRDKYLKVDGKHWKKQKRHLKRSLKHWASQLADNYTQVKDTTASILADSAQAMSQQSKQLMDSLHSLWSSPAPTHSRKYKRSKRH